jgi:hypothetical protein
MKCMNCGRERPSENIDSALVCVGSDDCYDKLVDLVRQARSIVYAAECKEWAWLEDGKIVNGKRYVCVYCFTPTGEGHTDRCVAAEFMRKTEGI